MKDQTFTAANAGLKQAMDVRDPVRVIRGLEFGFVYEGLYKITEWKKEKSKDG